MKLEIERPHKKYRNMIFERSNLKILSTNYTETNGTDIFTSEITNYKEISV